jgi:hypothetical protein
MEIERLPLGQSLADKHRAAELRWRGMPPGIPPEMAVEFMARLRAGSTVRKLTGGGRLVAPDFHRRTSLPSHARPCPFLSRPS